MNDEHTLNSLVCISRWPFSNTNSRCPFRSTVKTDRSVGTGRSVCWTHCAPWRVRAGWRYRRPGPTADDGDVAKGFLFSYYYFFFLCWFLHGKAERATNPTSAAHRYLFTYRLFFRFSRPSHKQAQRTASTHRFSSPTSRYPRLLCEYNKSSQSKIIILHSSHGFSHSHRSTRVRHLSLL